MINKLYGLLAKEADPSALYYRKSTQAPVYARELDVLVPHTTEKGYRQFCADQLCQLVRRSKLADNLNALDPNNTYSRDTSTVAEAVTTINGLPSGVTTAIFENANGYSWIDRVIRLSYDGVSTVSYGTNKSVEWGAAGTPLISDGGISLTLNGVPPVTTFVADITLVRKPTRNILNVLADLDQLQGIEWSTDFEPYRDATVPTTRLAAYVLNMLGRL